MSFFIWRKISHNQNRLLKILANLIYSCNNTVSRYYGGWGGDPRPHLEALQSGFYACHRYSLILFSLGHWFLRCSKENETTPPRVLTDSQMLRAPAGHWAEEKLPLCSETSQRAKLDQKAVLGLNPERSAHNGLESHSFREFLGKACLCIG